MSARPALLDDPALGRVLAVLPEARLVGGCVRDHLAGCPVADIDIATPRPPEAVVQALDGAHLRSIPTGLAHGTVTALVGRRQFEITTLRRDLATDGRHAVVAFTDDWRADAARRDFTFNAMSMDQAGAIHDYFDGRSDLARGIVRFVGDPAARIAEDRLRVLRFFRFFARYGQAPPASPVEQAIVDAVPQLAFLSAERVWAELGRLLDAPDPSAAIALMARLGVLAAVIPEGVDPARLARLLTDGVPADRMLRLAALLAGDPAAFAARLRLATEDRIQLTALHGAPPDPRADGADLRRLLADTEKTILIGRCWLAGSSWHPLRERLEVAERPAFGLEGRDVLALGVVPGPPVGDLLRQVRAWWLAGGCVAGLAECRAYLRRLVDPGET